MLSCKFTNHNLMVFVNICVIKMYENVPFKCFTKARINQLSIESLLPLKTNITVTKDYTEV